MDSYCKVRKKSLKLKKNATEDTNLREHDPRKRKGADPLTKKLALLEGRIVSNGQTVQGLNTRFRTELRVGDVIGIQHPTSMELEVREVVELISERTLMLKSAFSTDVISTCAVFLVQRANGEKGEGERNAKTSTNVDTNHEEDDESTHSRNVESTASDLLDARIKRMGRDKYC